MISRPVPDTLSRMRSKKILIKAFFALVLFLTIQKICHIQTGGFAMHKIISDLTPNPKWEPQGEAAARNDLGEKEALSIFDQPFYFLGKGKTIFAFVSEDRKYVIKFIRHNHLRQSLWVDLLPSSMKRYKDEQKAIMEEKLRMNFLGHMLGFEKLPEETQLVYLHLNKTSQLHKKLTIFDRIGIRHEIDLDNMEFVIQRKAMVICRQLEVWMREGKRETAELALDNLLKVLIQRREKGFFDRDPNVHLNYGYVGLTPVLIDTGGLLAYEDRPEKDRRLCKNCRDEIRSKTKKFRRWLFVMYPQLAEYFDKQIAALPNE